MPTEAQKDPIYKPLTKEEISYDVSAKATYYPDFTRVYLPNSIYTKIDPGYEPIKMPKPPTGLRNDEYETDVERSLRRTRKTIKDLVLCNDFDLFCTFTFKEDRQDIELCKKKMSNWLKNQQKRNGKFSYLIVAEFHKDKQSLHFHALFKNYAGNIRRAINKKTGKEVRGEVYELPGYTSGFTNVEIIDKKHSSRTKVGFYLQKYITKDMPLFFGKNRYWASKGLVKPKTEDNPEKWYEVEKPDREWATDYGKILEFDVGKHPLIDMFVEAQT